MSRCGASFRKAAGVKRLKIEMTAELMQSRGAKGQIQGRKGLRKSRLVALSFRVPVLSSCALTVISSRVSRTEGGLG